MTKIDDETLLRMYAKGGISWKSLRDRGFDNYRDVLGGLGRLGLRPPLAAMDGPNVKARLEGRALIRLALRDVAAE